MGIAIKAQASARLSATVTLGPHDTLQVVKAAVDGFSVEGRVEVRREDDSMLWLSLQLGSASVEVATFKAIVWVDGQATRLVVGGLDTYKTIRPKVYGLIPVGTEEIWGIGIYREFLAAVQAELTLADAGGLSRVSQPVSIRTRRRDISHANRSRAMIR